jgi:hypothetical protein
MQEIKVIIAKDGAVKIDVECMKGASCKEITKSLEKALGATVSDELKSEYYENDNQLENTQGQGY